MRKHSDLAQDYKNGDYDWITYEIQKGKLLQFSYVFTQPKRRGKNFALYFTSLFSKKKKKLESPQKDLNFIIELQKYPFRTSTPPQK